MDPYQDKEISSKRTKCLKRDFPKNVDGQVDSIEYAKFLTQQKLLLIQILFVIKDEWSQSIGRFFIGLRLQVCKH